MRLDLDQWRELAAPICEVFPREPAERAGVEIEIDETDGTTDLAGGAPNLSGSVPTFYNAVDQTVATFDPTLLSTEAAALGDLTNLLSQVGLGAIDGFGLGLGSDPSTGFAPLGFMPLDSDDAHVTERLGRAWVTALGGQMDHDGSRSTLDSTVTQAGFARGYTWQQAPDLILNAMAGYAAGSSKADATWSPSFDHDTDTFFAGLHGKRALGFGQLGEGAVQFGVTAGYAHIDHNLNAVTLGATLRGDLGETAFLELDANYLHGDTAQGFDGRLTVGMAF